MCRAAEKTSKCEDTTLDPTAALRASVTVPPAPPDTFTVDGAFQDVSLTLETNGGINPWDVSFGIARDVHARHRGHPRGPRIRHHGSQGRRRISGGRLTLPYGEALLGGFPEANLRIYTYDTDAQLWVPLAEPQTVDTTANTVTANISHLSVYAVLKGRTLAEWRQVFGETPIRCVGGVGGGFGIDASFLVDTSGSMASNDPSGLRVDGAKLFVAQMRPGDRASVVGFDSFATREIGLTTLEQPGERQRGQGRARPDTGRERRHEHLRRRARRRSRSSRRNGGGSRLRIVVLLTDGVSSPAYDNALTTQAADAAIEIHTVGLGSGVDANVLRSIATGTGGTYRQLTQAAQLPALYQELVQDIIDDGTDSDGDTLERLRGAERPLHSRADHAPGG